MTATHQKQLLALATCALLAACGGGSSKSTAGSTSAFSQGAIQRFGSVFVNGVEWRTQGATLRTPDDSTTSRSLANETEIRSHVGEGAVVRVKGTLDSDGKHGQATEIEFHHSMSGTVSSVSDDGFVVAGVKVHVEAETHHRSAAGVDDKFSSRGVQVGDRVRVSGSPDDKGGLRASSVSDDSTATELEAKGYALAAPAGNVFPLALTPNGTIALNVNVAGATLPAGFAAGSFVEVRGTVLTPGSPPTLTATSVSLEDDVKGQAQMEAEVEGIVTSGTAASFVVAGTTVTTSASTTWVGAADPANPTADFAVGSKVEAEGTLDANGTLVAKKVKFKDSARIGAAIAAVGTPGAGQTAAFTMLGKSVVVTSDTQLDGVTLGQLVAGAFVEVRGFPLADGSILAQRVKLGSGGGGGSQPYVVGVVSAKSSPSLTVLGLTLDTTGAEFRAEDDTALTSQAFFDAVTTGSTLVKARWPAGTTSTTTALKQVEIETQDS